ncbi:MAG: hypothetical protein WAT43_17280 [Chitinophagales bacterium]
MQIGNQILICPYCGQPTKVVWVHGHGQCMICKTNFDECCRGETTDETFNQKEETESEKEKNKTNNNTTTQDENN